MSYGNTTITRRNIEQVIADEVKRGAEIPDSRKMTERFVHLPEQRHYYRMAFLMLNIEQRKKERKE